MGKLRTCPLLGVKLTRARTGHLIVNPNDKLEVAEAIRDALHMGQRDRVTRWQTMIGPLRKHDVSWWTAAFLKELA
jgi:trehalose 6-phosphate synthase